MLAAAPYIAQAGSALLGVFGRKKKGTGTPQMQLQGFAGAPPEIKNQMLQLARQGYDANNPKMRAIFEQYPLSQEDIDTNPEFQALQARYPNEPMWQRGVLAQRSQAQKQAYDLARKGFSKEALADYYQPYEDAYQAGANEINRVADQYKQDITSQNALLNSRINPETNQQLQRQYADLEQRRGQNLGGLRGMLQRGAAEHAIDTRFRHGAELAQRGGEQQAYHQQQLNATSGAGRIENDPRFQQAMALQPLYNGILSGATNTGAIPAQGNMLTRLGGAASQLMNMNYGMGQYMQPQYGGYGMQPMPQSWRGF